MLTSIISVTFIALLIVSNGVQAAGSIGVGLEDYHWQETIVGSPPLSPEETGVRYSINIKWEQDKDRGQLPSGFSKAGL